ncbi:MAG TPA: gephyrin-like molybdotransferase Glp [Dongiaceae bacterium]|nr:gephyrin-like molybdotransferase Glp [Dongiaceae bacterium]
MLSVQEATDKIVSAFAPIGAELVSLDQAFGRVLAEPLTARLTQPPADVTAMDGYAIRAADAATLPARLKVTMNIAAGQAPEGTLGKGEAARIFTGAPVPRGADAIVIQENTDRDGDWVTVREGDRNPGQHIRRAGFDFKAGEVVLQPGRRLSVRDIALAAAMNRPWLNVARKPRVALLSTGDELVNPGDDVGPAQIIGSNGIGLAAFVTACGAEPLNLGIARDNMADLDRHLNAATGCDALVTMGGASVGDHDLVQKALQARQAQLDFWKIAMRPGKPVMFGRLGSMNVLGLPGNPVSSIVTATLFLKPAIERMLGLTQDLKPNLKMVLGRELRANDTRQDYMRARLSVDAEGRTTVAPFDKQDSAMLSLLSSADCLIIRPPHAPAAKAGDLVEVLMLGGGCLSI